MRLIPRFQAMPHGKSKKEYAPWFKGTGSQYYSASASISPRLVVAELDDGKEIWLFSSFKRDSTFKPAWVPDDYVAFVVVSIRLFRSICSIELAQTFKYV